MRETITIAFCLLLIFLGLQTGFLRTGMDYESLQKKMENLQTANDRLSEELKRTPGAVANLEGAGAGQQQIDELKAELEHYRTAENTGNQKTRELKTKWLKEFNQEIKAGDCEIRDEDGRMVFMTRDQFLFKGDTNGFNRPAQELLLKFAHAIREQKDMEIQILAHTDFLIEGKNAGEKNAKTSALALSRAQAVGDFLDVQGGVDPVQMVASSCGHSRPVVSNDSEYHRAQNRRFEFWIQPVNPRGFNQARKIARFEKQFKSSPPAPKIEKTVKPSAEDTETKPIGAEALDQDDAVNFKGGYEKPQE
jgi:outer membrane protein OmpA-like peptidoglycan-associated protein